MLSISNSRAIAGPFRGMRYVEQSSSSAFWPKLLGTYEKELHVILDRLKGTTFDNVLVVGAGEGHYAVGLSFLVKARQIIAFETEEDERALLAKTRQENNVQIEIAGACTPSILREFVGLRNLIVIDIEGDEDFFLQDGVIVEMMNSNCIIEVHSRQFLSKTREMLSNAFLVEFVPVQQRTFQDFPLKLAAFQKLLRRYWTSLVQEWRSDSIGWIILTPKS